jgi:hypothetical protein
MIRRKYNPLSPEACRSCRRLLGPSLRIYSRLDEISSETVMAYAAFRQAQGLQVSTVNSSLPVLRRVLRMSVEWGAVESIPRVKMLPGEKHGERVVTPEEEAKYLLAPIYRL